MLLGRQLGYLTGKPRPKPVDSGGFPGGCWRGLLPNRVRRPGINHKILGVRLAGAGLAGHGGAADPAGYKTTRALARPFACGSPMWGGHRPRSLGDPLLGERGGPASPEPQPGPNGGRAKGRTFAPPIRLPFNRRIKGPQRVSFASRHLAWNPAHSRGDHLRSRPTT